MTHTSSKLFLAGAMALGLAAPAMAVNSHYAPGDLVLTFQKVGSTNTVYADLGSAAAAFRGSAAGPDAANLVNFLDLGATLTNAFGAGWASDPDVFAGLSGVFATSSTTNTVVNGDPARTLYVSSPRTDVGTVGTANSTAWVVLGNTDMTNAAADIQAQNNVFGDLDSIAYYGYDAQVIISTTDISLIDDKQPVTTFQGTNIQQLAFRAFDGGVQQAGAAGSFGSFGAAGSVEFALDLYRIVGKTGLAGEVAGVLRNGSFEGTVTVNGSGMVSFVAQGGAAPSPLATWIAGFSSITADADKLPSADPDHDGLSNLMEFVLNGNPGISDNASILPTLNASGSNFVFGFSRRVDSESGSTLLFQYGSDLVGWTDATVGAASGTVGSATVVVTPNISGVDAISVTVPKTVAAGGKLFGRLKVTQP